MKLDNNDRNQGNDTKVSDIEDEISTITTPSSPSLTPNEKNRTAPELMDGRPGHPSISDEVISEVTSFLTSICEKISSIQLCVLYDSLVQMMLDLYRKLQSFVLTILTERIYFSSEYLNPIADDLLENFTTTLREVNRVFQLYVFRSNLLKLIISLVIGGTGLIIWSLSTFTSFPGRDESLDVNIGVIVLKNNIKEQFRRQVGALILLRHAKPSVPSMWSRLLSLVMGLVNNMHVVVTYCLCSLQGFMHQAFHPFLFLSFFCLISFVVFLWCTIWILSWSLAVNPSTVNPSTVNPLAVDPISTENCSTCENSIVGSLYKSKIKKNVSLCEDCVRKNPIQYPLIKYPDPKTRETNSRGSSAYILNKSCTVCSSKDRGIRYKCLERPNHYMCSNCERKDNTKYPRLMIPMF